MAKCQTAKILTANAISAQILPLKAQDQHQPIHRVPVNGSNMILRFYG